MHWPDTATGIHARVDGCTFCKAHAAAWTSHRDAQLVATVRSPSLVNKYRFGTRTADFYICTQCGVVPWAISEIENRLYAVVNVNTFTNVDPPALARTAGSFDGEEVGDRLARRARNWVSHAKIASA